MTPDLLTQLAQYGDYHREQQQPIGLVEIVAPGDEIRPAGTVTPFEHRRNSVTESRSPRLWLAAAAAALVIVALAMILLIRPSDEPEVADEQDGAPAPTVVTSAPTTTLPLPAFSAEDALAVMDTYYEAFNADDIDLLMAQYIETSDGVVTNCYNIQTDCIPAGAVGLTWTEHFTTSRALGGMQVRERSCGVIQSESGQHTVECSYLEDTAYTFAAGMDAVPVVDTAVVGEAGIEQLGRLVGPPDYVPGIDRFNAWLARSNPDGEIPCCEWASRSAAEEAASQVVESAAAWRVFLEAAGCVGDPRCAVADDSEGVIEVFATIYNVGNMDALATLVAESVTLSNHPRAALASGRGPVLDALGADRSDASPDEPLLVSNVVVSDDAVTWDHVWTDAEDTTWCGTGNVAELASGQIVSWTFAPDHQPCEQ